MFLHFISSYYTCSLFQYWIPFFILFYHRTKCTGFFCVYSPDSTIIPHKLLVDFLGIVFRIKGPLNWLNVGTNSILQKTIKALPQRYVLRTRNPTEKWGLALRNSELRGTISYLTRPIISTHFWVYTYSNLMELTKGPSGLFNKSLAITKKCIQF